MQLILRVRETATPLQPFQVVGRENFVSQHFCGSRALSSSALKMSDWSDEMSDRRPPRCPGGFLSKLPSAKLIIWILNTLVSLSVNLSLVILGTLLNDPEKCKIVQVPQFMMITGSYGLGITLMSVAVLWQKNICMKTIVWHQMIITVPAVIYTFFIIENLSPMARHCNYPVAMFAGQSALIAPLFLLLSVLIKLTFDLFF